jgi:hypothetical protein
MPRATQAELDPPHSYLLFLAAQIGNYQDVLSLANAKHLEVILASGLSCVFYPIHQQILTVTSEIHLPSLPPPQSEALPFLTGMAAVTPQLICTRLEQHLSLFSTQQSLFPIPSHP